MSIASLRELVASLAQHGSWMIAPPRFLHQVESDCSTRADDELIVTLARPSEGRGVDLEVELTVHMRGKYVTASSIGFSAKDLLEQW